MNGDRTARAHLGRILIATSGSASSRAALELGLSLAASTGAEVTALLVVPTSDRRVDTVRVGPLGHTLTHHLTPAEPDPPLKEALARARELGVRCRIELVAANRPAAAIVAQARECHADLVVMGTSGGRLRKAARVLRGAHTPVLLVGSGESA